MSYATVVSICPAEVNQGFPHTMPARVSIPPGEIDKPVLCVFADGEERQYIGSNVNKDPWVKYPVLSLDLAKGMVNSYKASATYVEPNAYPGIFAVNGKPEFVTVETFGVTVVLNEGNETKINSFISQHTAELNKAKTQQYNWFKKLVQVADRSFAKNSNYAEISTLQRYASKVLNLERPWNKEIKPEDFRKCPFCASFVEPMAVICIQCHNVVDVAKYNALKSQMDLEVSKTTPFPQKAV